MNSLSSKSAANSSKLVRLSFWYNWEFKNLCRDLRICVVCIIIREDLLDVIFEFGDKSRIGMYFLVIFNNGFPSMFQINHLWIRQLRRTQLSKRSSSELSRKLGSYRDWVHLRIPSILQKVVQSLIIVTRTFSPPRYSIRLLIE